MHVINGSRVQLNVLVVRDSLGLVDIARKTSVKLSEGHSHGPVAKSFNNWVVNIELHRADKGSSDQAKPSHGEVAKGAIHNFSQEIALLREVSVNNEKKNTSVEESKQEDALRNEHHFF